MKMIKFKLIFFFKMKMIIGNDFSVFCDFCKQMRNQTTRHGVLQTRMIQKMIDNDCRCEVCSAFVSFFSLIQLAVLKE